MPTPYQLSNAKGLGDALLNSGAFLEARLLTGQTPAQAPDMKATLLRLIAQILPGLPSSTSFNPGMAASTQAQAMPTFVRNALGMLGQVGAKPQPGGFPLPQRSVQGGEHEDSLENLLKLSQWGAVILPPSPGFYHHPKSMEDLVDFVVARILDQLRIEHNLMQKWGA